MSSSRVRRGVLTLCARVHLPPPTPNPFFSSLTLCGAFFIFDAGADRVGTCLFVLWSERLAEQGRRVQPSRPRRQRRDQGQPRRSPHRFESHPRPLPIRAFFTSISSLAFCKETSSDGEILGFHFWLSRAQIEKARDMDEEIDGLLERQRRNHPHQILHFVGYY